MLGFYLGETLSSFTEGDRISCRHKSTWGSLWQRSGQPLRNRANFMPTKHQLRQLAHKHPSQLPAIKSKKKHLGSDSSLESTPLQWETSLQTGVSTLQTQRASTSSPRMQNNSWNYLWGVPGVQLGCQLPPRWGKSICAASLEETQTTTWHGDFFPPEANSFWFPARGSPRRLHPAGASSWRRHHVWGLYREGLPAATSDWCRFQQRVTTHSRYLRGFPGGSWRRHLLPWRGKPA